MSKYKRNHYVPVWYQSRFIPESSKENKYFYLDLKPEILVSNNHAYKRASLLHWGPNKCFVQRDLYTTKFGDEESIEIEKKFFGEIDSRARDAINFFSEFTHPSVDPNAFNLLLLYMSLQKLRTPKGLKYLASIINLKDKNEVLFAMQEFQKISCALWAECVWSIVDASKSETKFIISDHPVTVYNQKCFPSSQLCGPFKDPNISLVGTYTLFPLSLNKMLILANLSWVRNPYMNPLKVRPNPNPFRSTVFNFCHIQTGRELTELEVNEINYIIKKRAYRYIASPQKDWLYPEHKIKSPHWDKLGNGYLLMPDPRSVQFTTSVVIGYQGGSSDAFDEYGHKPWQEQYDDKSRQEDEWLTFHAFRGQFARIFGSKRRGRTYEFGRIDADDSPEYHASLLKDEQIYKNKLKQKKKFKKQT